MSARAFVMAGGGTGGHVIPGLAVARELAARGHKPLFVGTRQGMEARLVPAAGFPIEWIQIGGLKGLGLLRRLRTVFELPGSVWRALRILRRAGAAGVFSMGGYVAAPVVIAAALRRTPVILMEPNAVPGMTNRRLARFARRALVSFEEALPYFPPGSAEPAGLPVRAEFFAIPDKTPAEPPVLLVTGGSRGSRSLNHAVRDLIPRLDFPLRIVLQTGRDHYEEMKSLASEQVEIVPFLDDMPAAFAGADILLCRSGAGAVAELAAAGKPAILVPYPYAADDHQMANARALERAGAAAVIADRALTGERLHQTLLACLAPGHLKQMSAAARTLAKPGAAARAAGLLEEFAEAKN